MIDAPDLHCFVSARRNQRLDHRHVDYPQNRSLMADDCLEALVRLRILGLPQLDGTIRTAGYEHLAPVDFREDQLADSAFVGRRGDQLDAFMVFAAVNDHFGVHYLLLVEKDFAIC